MSKHGDALLNEILKDPASDPPRLVYADHLEQEGDIDRANLIRHQVRRASLPSWDDQAVTLELAERALLDKHELTWRAHLPVLAGVRWGRFARGFVGTIKLDFDAFEQLEAVSAASPVNALALRWPDEETPKLPAAPTIDELTFTGTMMRPDDLKWLAGSPLLGSIRTLNLIDASIRNGWPQFLKSKYLGKLAALRMPEQMVGNAGLKKLATATLPSLVELDFTCNTDEGYSSGRHYSSPAITSKGVMEFAAWSGLAQLHTLDLSGAKLGADGLLMLLASPHTKALKNLRIRGIKDSDWDMDDSLGAFKSGPYGTLDELDISDNDLDPEAANYLAESKAMRELKVLRIANVKSSSFERLAKAGWVKHLRVLECTEQSLPYLLKRVPEKLHTLKIAPSAAPLSKVAAHLAANPPPTLQRLDLSACRIDDLAPLHTLALPKLVALTLPRKLAGVKELAASKLGQQLVSLDAGNPEVDRLPAPPAYVERDDI